ncbi:MAG: hypothetical protein K1X75_14075 [Leptospirales bacterium]|nr:hypothetical protein [Leptospirales bacterium]
MNRITLHGVYRRNTRGRAYIISKAETGAYVIYRAADTLPLRNGELAYFSGIARDGWLFPDRIASDRSPRRNSRTGASIPSIARASA